MNFRSTCSLLVAFVLTLLTLPVWAQSPEADSIKDRIAIQEKLLYAYAYTYNSKDCVGWSKLFTTDAVLIGEPGGAISGRDAIQAWCIARQKSVLTDVKTRHNMMNVVFDQLTPRYAETRTYFILTWQRPGEPITVRANGTYRDVIVKSDDGTWLFKERKIEP